MLHGLVHQAKHASSKTVRLALRWMLILVTALLLSPPSLQVPPPGGFVVLLLLFFAASNVALSFLPEARFRAGSLEQVMVVADTFLVSLGLFHAGLWGVHLPLVFFLILLLTALGADLGRTLIGATLVSVIYVYLIPGGPAGPQEMTALLLRVPFFYGVALYYGYLVSQARAEKHRARQEGYVRRELATFAEISSATTSTLDLEEVLYVIVQRTATLLEARRCSILKVEEGTDRCTVLASSDDRNVHNLVLDLSKYPEVRRAIETRKPVVIEDVAREPALSVACEKLEQLGFHSMIVLPLTYRENLLGMLFLRAARTERVFSSEQIRICEVIANASVNAIQNALLYEKICSEARRHRETSLKLQNILDHFPDLIYATDVAGRLTEFSRGGEVLLGYRREELLGRPCTTLYSGPPGRTQIEALIQDGRPMDSIETMVLHRDGSERDVLVTASPVRDENGNPCGTVGIIKDISVLKAARRQLVQAEKLSAVGEVVSGVAHELNNPLTAVLGFAQLLMGGPIHSQPRKWAERIFEAALRCQNIVRDLLTFSRCHEHERRYLGLNGIVEKTVDMKAYQLQVDGIRVVNKLDSSLPKTMLNFNQVQQVLMNLINNAQQALASRGKGGTLSFTTFVRGGAIVLEVADDGPGMPPEVLGRIFEPFFTTKPVGQGTGLGLSVSYGIIRDHGGRIWADSHMGRGTKFAIELPIREERPADEPTIGAEKERGLPGRSLKVLAVDDETNILDLLVDAFVSEGHSIDTASSGQQALRKLESGSYDVVLLDLRMPAQDGRQLFTTIRKRWPEMSRRVIFATGDTAHPDSRRFIEESGRPCVEKPFKLETLAAAFAAVANGAGAADPSAIPP